MCDFNACGNRNWDGFQSRRIFCILLSTMQSQRSENLGHVNPSRCLLGNSALQSDVSHKHADVLPTWLISLQFGGTNVMFILVGSRTSPSDDGPV